MRAAGFRVEENFRVGKKRRLRTRIIRGMMVETGVSPR